MQNCHPAKAGSGSGHIYTSGYILGKMSSYNPN